MLRKVSNKCGLSLSPYSSLSFTLGRAQTGSGVSCGFSSWGHHTAPCHPASFQTAFRGSPSQLPVMFTWHFLEFHLSSSLVPLLLSSASGTSLICPHRDTQIRTRESEMRRELYKSLAASLTQDDMIGQPCSRGQKRELELSTRLALPK